MRVLARGSACYISWRTRLGNSPLSSNSRHSCQIIVYDEMNACGHVGQRRLMDGLLMMEIISLVIAGSSVCQVPAGGLTSLRPSIFISRLESDNNQDHPWINTVPSPDIIKLPMQICLHHADILMTPESVQVMRPGDNEWMETWTLCWLQRALSPVTHSKVCLSSERSFHFWIFLSPWFAFMTWESFSSFSRLGG